MASIVVGTDCIAVTCEQRVLAVSMKDGELHVLELQNPPKTEETNNKEGKEPSETCTPSVHVSCTDISLCNKWIAVCSSDKLLSLWDTSNWSPVSTRRIVRAANKVKFTSTAEYIVVADKSGDAYIFSVNEPHREGVLLLGHLSMLLDILISDDERYIISCDRDEKIRVSHFPNAYNIQSFCLGHTEFVSSLSFLPHNKSVLISGSGDGTIKLWDYVPGTLVQNINCSDILKSNQSISSECTTTKSYCPSQSKCESDINIQHAIVRVSCCNTYEYSRVGVSLANFKVCLIYKIEGDTNIISYSLLETVYFESELWDISFAREDILWYLSCKEAKPLNVKYFNKNGKIISEKEHTDDILNVLNLVNSQCQFFTVTAISERMTVLYKRKYDNVQEYYEKKKVRLSS